MDDSAAGRDLSLRPPSNSDAAELDPANADADFNAAHLCEQAGQIAVALRHLKAYRQPARSDRR